MGPFGGFRLVIRQQQPSGRSGWRRPALRAARRHWRSRSGWRPSQGAAGFWPNVTPRCKSSQARCLGIQHNSSACGRCLAVGGDAWQDAKSRAQWLGFSVSLMRCAYASELSMPLHASTRPLTAATDVSNICCSSLFSLMLTIFSMPPAPITVGTPTYMSLRPRSPSQ